MQTIRITVDTTEQIFEKRTSEMFYKPFFFFLIFYLYHYAGDINIVNSGIIDFLWC